MIRAFAAAYERCDLLLGATAPTTAFELGAKTADPMAMYLSDVFTIPSNLSGEAAITVPVRRAATTGCPSACSCSARRAASRGSSPRRGCSRRAAP